MSKETIDRLKKRVIKTEGLQIKEGEKTFFWSGKYHQDMNTRDTIDTQLNVLESFDPIVPNSYQDCDILMLGNLTPSVQMKVIQQMETRPKLIVLDTETTGLEVDQGHRIIEIGAVLLEDRKRTDQHFHTYLNPQRAIDEEAQKVHGISNEKVKNENGHQSRISD